MSYTFLGEVSQSARSERAPSLHYRVWGKRALDIFAVLLSAPVTLPIVAVAALLTLVNGGKAIYSQPRVGRDGRVFRCWKIRTMELDAEQNLQCILDADPALAVEWRTNQKLENDPRITPLGKALRRSSIDELPQLWNVLTGEMSLIGPRPFTPCQKSLYDIPGQKRAYYRIRPGITGLWQVSCRNNGAFQERVSFDDNYEQNLTLGFDLKISIRTLVVIAQGTGK